jgi:DNA-binding Lrp family transcriptional regulator
MSGEQQTEDSELTQEVAQQLNLYDNLFPEVESKELQALFALIRIYLARCDNPQLKREHLMINPHLINKLVLTYFDPFGTPTRRDLREALVSRLNSIRKYRITNAEIVRRALVTCLFEDQRGIRRKQKLYLDAFMKNPDRPLTEIARQLSVTPQAASRACQLALKSELIRFWGHINYPAFKLRHFAVFFNVLREFRGSTDFLRRLFFDNLPFALSLNIDIYEGSNWASFVVPNQKKQLDEFKDSLAGLKGEVFQDFEMCEIKSYSTGSNFEFFDGKRWFFDPQLWSYGFFEFVRENKEILKKATELKYAEQPVVFQGLDFSIATILATNPLLSHNSIAQQLRQFGYNVSRPTVTRRINRLVRPIRSSTDSEDGTCPAVYPYMSYSGLGLNSLSLYVIECDEKYMDEMYYAVGYLPYYFLYRTNKGIILSVKSTSEDVAKFNYMIKAASEIKVVTYSNRFESMGTKGVTDLQGKWDETEQRWICPTGELDFVRRYESIS